MAQAKQAEVNVKELRQRLGQRMTIEIDLLLGELSVVASKTTDAPVTGSLTIESIERGVTVSGSVTFGWIGECRRCLEPIEGTEQVSIFEVVQYGAPEGDDIIDFDGEHVELYPIVHDTVLTALPLVPLCREDCRGPDPERYPAIPADEFEASKAEPKADPRWAALDDLALGDDNDG